MYSRQRGGLGVQSQTPKREVGFDTYPRRAVSLSKEAFTPRKVLVISRNKTSTGFSSPDKHRTTIIATLTKSPRKIKSDNNQCLYSLEDRMEDWQLC